MSRSLYLARHLQSVPGMSIGEKILFVSVVPSEFKEQGRLFAAGLELHSSEAAEEDLTFEFSNLEGIRIHPPAGTWYTAERQARLRAMGVAVLKRARLAGTVEVRISGGSCENSEIKPGLVSKGEK